MILSDRIEAFSQLGKVIHQVQDVKNQYSLSPSAKSLRQLIHTVQDQNPWFTPGNVIQALSSIAISLSFENLITWTGTYPSLTDKRKKQRIGVTLAGNIPMVGFHDFLSVTLSGHHFIGKLSSKDNKLLPAVSDVLCDIQPDFSNYIDFIEGPFKSIDAIIATGSDNSARYFDFYFSRYPNIIRRNRNGVAILDGSESKTDLIGLGDDIFNYFGLGCRNVSKLYIPENYDFNPLIRALMKYSHLADHPKYHNNYWYNRARYITQQIPVIDTGFLLFKEETEIASPPAVIFIEYYKNPDELPDHLFSVEDRIQCIVSKDNKFNPVPFGGTQLPELWEYADNIDTLEFLISLNIKDK